MLRAKTNEIKNLVFPILHEILLAKNIHGHYFEGANNLVPTNR